MEENNIFPADILNNTVEHHIAKHSKKSNLIFWIIFLSLFGAFISLPFIHVDVYTTSRGMIVSEEKPVSLYFPAGGKITLFNIDENKSVKKGDTLLIINQKILNQRNELLNLQLDDTKDFISDLKALLKYQFSAIKTNQFKKEYLQYQQQLFNANTLINNAEVAFKRSEKLYNKNVIARSEYDNSLLELNKLKNNKTNIIKQNQLSWQKQLTDYEQSLDNITSNIDQLKEEKDTYVLTAPIDGELINVQGFNKGSIVNAGINIAEISPAKGLIIESYITPSDIGYIKEGISAKYQVDSYNSNQWGFATGKITEVGKDLVNVGNSSIFKVRSSLNEKTLNLSNGAEGTLKKGMTVTSRFFLTRRSLFQLLFDKIEDWFNPYNSKNE